MKELQWSAGPVFQPAGGRTAGLRRGREVFEGEEPFQIIAHADHTAETSASGGPSLQNGRPYWEDAQSHSMFRSFFVIFYLQPNGARRLFSSMEGEARQAASPDVS